MTFTTTLDSLNASSSLTETPNSISVSPTQHISSFHRRAILASNPANSADVCTADPQSSSNMGSKQATSPKNPADEALDTENRRASGRVRKPTAKAVALNGSKSYSPPLADTIVIGETTPKRRRSSAKDHSPSLPILKDEPEDMNPQIDQEIPEIPLTTKTNGTTTPPPQDNTPSTSAVIDSPPSRRQSLREKTLTPKALSKTRTSRKRSIGEDAEDAPVRKSSRISHAATKVPSKLRYSVSSEPSELQDNLADENVEPAQLASPKKSMIITLKYKKTCSAQPIAEPQPKPAKVSTPKKDRTRRTSKRQKIGTTENTTTAIAPMPIAAFPACNLSCLPPPSRLVAMAEIALIMPDEKDDAQFVPGSANDWTMYTQSACRCAEYAQARANHAMSNELTQEPVPNSMATTTLAEYDLPSNQTPESDLLAMPVNTIIRASDAERLSQLYSAPSTMPPQQPQMGTVTNGKRRADDFMDPLPDQPPSKRVSLEGNAHSHFQNPQTAYPSHRSFEDRLRDDYNALADMRKRATARHIPWTYNHTFDDIFALVAEAEEQEQRTQYSQRSIDPPTVLGRAQETGEVRTPPTGFGVLLPPKGTTFIQRASVNGLPPNRRGSTSLSSTTTGGGPSKDPAGPAKISFVTGNNGSQPAKSRRPSSPSRPKSSRFRVDPRGLQGQSPGPGTIINMAELKRKSEETKRLNQEASEKKRREQAEEEKRNDDDFKARIEKIRQEAVENEKRYAEETHTRMTAEIEAIMSMEEAMKPFRAWQKAEEEKFEKERKERYRMATGTQGW